MNCQYCPRDAPRCRATGHTVAELDETVEVYLICTREEGHTGRHAGCGFEHPIGFWCECVAGWDSGDDDAPEVCGRTHHDSGWICSREPDHDGPHSACGYEHRKYVWTDDRSLPTERTVTKQRKEEMDYYQRNKETIVKIEARVQSVRAMLKVNDLDNDRWSVVDDYLVEAQAQLECAETEIKRARERLVRQ